MSVSCYSYEVFVEILGKKNVKPSSYQISRQIFLLILIKINILLNTQKNLGVTGNEVDLIWSEFKEQERIVSEDITQQMTLTAFK